MRRIAIALTGAMLTFAAVAGAAAAGKPAASTFIVVLSAAEEVPTCTAATNAARGVAVFQVTNNATGTVRWKLVANNLPGTPTAAHIHQANKGAPGPIRQGLDGIAGENGVIGTGTFSNPVVLAGLRANPRGYYVNVHSTVCGAGVIRGQFGDHGA